jgi:NADH-quinone oxidoreductase subunit M
LHGWLLSAVGSSPAPVGVLLVGGVAPMGVYGLVRFGFGLLPEGVAWATTTLGVLGVLGALWAALGALAERELARFGAYAVAAQSACALIALSGLTGMGVQGALALASSLALAGTGLLVVAAVLRDRVQISDSSRFGGLAAELPVFGVLSGAVFLGSMAVPGTLAFVGQAAGFAGAFPLHPALVLLALLVLVAIGVAHLSAYSRTFFGKLPDSWRRSRFLEPHGGKFPALESRELIALGLCAALVVLLGVYPKLVLRLTDSSALDYAERVSPPGPTEVALAPPTHADPARLALNSH